MGVIPKFDFPPVNKGEIPRERRRQWKWLCEPEVAITSAEDCCRFLKRRSREKSCQLMSSVNSVISGRGFCYNEPVRGNCYFGLQPSYSECGPWTHSLSWGIVRNANLGNERWLTGVQVWGPECKSLGSVWTAGCGVISAHTWNPSTGEAHIGWEVLFASQSSWIWGPQL